MTSQHGSRSGLQRAALALALMAPAGLRAQDEATVETPTATDTAGATDPAAPEATVAPTAADTSLSTSPEPGPTASPAEAAAATTAIVLAAGLDPYADMSLEDLMDVKVEVATRGKARSMRVAPSILTLITRDEIAASGARDLKEILDLVPSFQFGTDVMDLSYLGIRGMWAAEGKVLILVDGHEVHEPMYTNAQLGNRFSASQIERVEIIRGPGSVIYGGAAGLAVINVVTRDAKSLNGFRVSGTYSELVDGVAFGEQGALESYGKRNLSLSYGQVFAGLGDLAVRGHALVGQSNRSDQVYTDVYGNSYNMIGNSSADPLQLNLAADWKGVHARYLFDWYRTTQRTAYDEVLATPLPADFLMSSFDLSYDWRFGDDLVLKPRFKHGLWQPWHNTDPSVDPELVDNVLPLYEDSLEQRFLLGMTASWDVRKDLNLMAGLEYTLDTAHDPVYGFIDPTTYDSTTMSGEVVDDMLYHNIATFAQALLETPYVDATAGFRFEWHNIYGGSFVPRAAMTKAHGPFHFKALAARSFRAPSNRNLAFTPDIVPEETTVLELELGYQLTDHLAIVGNGFDILLDKPIIYFYDETGEGYRNFTTTGTRGVEFELRYQRGPHGLVVGYAYYDAARRNDVPAYAVPDRDHVLLGMAPHKLTARLRTRFLDHVNLGVNGSLLLGDRYGIDRVDSVDGEDLPHYAQFTWDADQSLWPMLNSYVEYRDLGVDGLNLGLGVNNIFNVKAVYLQPYDSWHAPVIQPGLEVMARLSYGMDFGG